MHLSYHWSYLAPSQQHNLDEDVGSKQYVWGRKDKCSSWHIAIFHFIQYTIYCEVYVFDTKLHTGGVLKVLYATFKVAGESPGG